MTRSTRVAALLLLSLGSVALVGCDNNDGPLEKAGESLDDAVEDMGDAIEDATDK